MKHKTYRFASALFVLMLLGACGGKKKKGVQAGQPAPEDAIEMSVAIPLTPEQATAVQGITRTDDISRVDELVVDVYANDELIAEGVRGGVRAGVSGGVRAGVRAGQQGGVRAGQQEGVRAMSDRGHVAPGFTPGDEPGGSSRIKRDATEEDAISFEAAFFFPRKLAREGDNAVTARLRHRDEKKAELVQVRTKVKITGAGDPAQIEILDTPIDINEVELPDVDGDGVSTLLEVVSLGVGAALDAESKPTEEQVKAAIEKFAEKFIAEMKKQGLVVAVDISKIDLTPPVGGVGFVEGEATVSKLPNCEPGKTLPATDTAETKETSATFVLCANEPARFQCSVDGAPAEPCKTPLLVANLEGGRHSLVVTAQDGNGNTQQTFLSFRWKVISTQPPVALTPPTGLKVTAGSGGVSLSWDAMAGATGYTVFYGASAEGLTLTVRSTEPSTTIGNLTNGTTYYFSVVSTAGDRESVRSAAASATPVPQGQKILSAPGPVAAKAGDKQVTLTWSAVTGATGYKVYYGTKADALTSTVDAAATSASLAGLTNGTIYYFAVTAVAEGVESGKSEVVQAKPSAVPDPGVGGSACVLDSSKIGSCTL